MLISIGLSASSFQGDQGPGEQYEVGHALDNGVDGGIEMSWDEQLHLTLGRMDRVRGVGSPASSVKVGGVWESG